MACLKCPMVLYFLCLRFGCWTQLWLVLQRPHSSALGAFRVLLLVQGSTETACDPIGNSIPMNEQSFKVTSTCVRCLLSGEEEREITLVGYCDFKKMLMYRLDMETALVLASAVQIQAPDSASAEGGGNCVVTVEYMQKISEKHAAALSLGVDGVLDYMMDHESLFEHKI